MNSKNFKISVVVIDNASIEKFEIRNSKFEIDVKIIRSEKNLGFSGGQNVGIKYSLDNGADYILILNNDTIVDKDLIEELLNTAEKDKAIGIAVPKIYFASGSEFHKDKYKKEDLGKVFWYAGGEMDWKNVIGFHRGVDGVDSGQYDRIEKTDFASGCCMLVKREIFEKVGLLDEKFFLYYEDSDLCEKIRRKGYSIIYSPKAILWHKNAGSAGGSGSSLQDYYITRNRMLFGFRYASFRSKLALFKESIKLLAKGRYWQRRGISDFYLRRFGKGSFNV
jgi:GT2 family glycosyltransferase